LQNRERDHNPCSQAMQIQDKGPQSLFHGNLNHTWLLRNHHVLQRKAFSYVPELAIPPVFYKVQGQRSGCQMNSTPKRQLAL